MTSWGLLLILSFLALGLSRMSERTALRAAIWLTVTVVGAVSVGVL